MQKDADRYTKKRQSIIRENKASDSTEPPPHTHWFNSKHENAANNASRRPNEPDVL